LQPAPLEFTHIGKTATEIVKAASEWSADLEIR
jgi:hypothetical protein